MKMKLLNGKEINVELKQLGDHGDVSLMVNDFYVASIQVDGTLDLSRNVAATTELALDQHGKIKLSR
jgi:hypothetical protein